MSATLALAVAMGLMVSAGLGRRRLVWRDRPCAVCHRPLSRCTCHWL
jgi:hypothetical protein